ncbi:uroporphyrinogen-III synthase [Lodderomyces elongisporus]|uniref:uroporphyrinogen-III synthase n=1 Tax=Lodderomyces elongisporus TaxID=36914 RepID=UPI0029225433|nr:uroporphyrinogen-III synthase [Lodderomyces elongisporus]WLF79574.1 uroporphyrinogen-III synthase [Lodderomyces elongisporus]
MTIDDKQTVILLKNPSTPTDPYEALLQAKNYSPKFIRLLTHEHKDKSLTKQYLTNHAFLKDTQYFIITSQRAVEMFQECIEEIRQDAILGNHEENVVETILSKTGYTVGPATYSILKKVGFKDVRGGIDAGNGAKLSDLIINDIKDVNTKIVFFTGEIRKDIIPKKLTTPVPCEFLGFSQFEEFVMYKTMERDDIIDKFQELHAEMNGQGWVIFYSPQGTRDIVKHLKQNIREGKKYWKLGVIGPTTEEYLIANDLKPDVVAQRPDAESLCSAMIEFDTSNSQ